jgi:hypothetical protein
VLDLDVQGLLRWSAAAHPQAARGHAGSRGEEPGLLSSLGDNNARDTKTLYMYQPLELILVIHR